MTQVYFGRLIAERRKKIGRSQEEVAAVLGMTRANYSQIETGRRKDVLDPDRAIKLARLLDLDMLTLVNAMGFSVKAAGVEDPRDSALLAAFHRAEPSVQRAILRGLEVET